MQRFHRIAIIGVGLIGGSCALALKANGSVGRVVGVGRSRANLDKALELGVVDEVCDSVRAGVDGADAVLVSTPVGQFGRVLAEAEPALGPSTVITDGGSTKRDVVLAAREALGDAFARFVPAHPIAGAEKSGVEAARADLFAGRHVVLTPCAETATDAVERVEAFWLACGAKLSRLPAPQHDAVFAAVSHLPHVLAYALVNMIASRSDADLYLGYAAGGFRDFTRIASSSPEMWRDIALANGDLLVAEIDRYTETLAALREAIARGDGVALSHAFEQARSARNDWLRTQENG
ncbi:MAG: prephenate dehydrogenase/arogenate dehydrogenase family protein [Betaproteobacteria bacterium]|nr:prephenate dehydrogenase/arogenate dehydrogenase family protein [Betaproteobacteria bacterium]